MKLGLSLGYWGAGPPAGAQEAVLEAETLGFDSVWTSEAYGSDALTPLAWWGARTTRLRLGTAILQMSARAPAATAMAAITMDHLSGGRFVLGIGASGPQVVEGWYGQPYPRPLARTREYLEIVRRVLARDEPVTFSGEHHALPYPGGTGLGKALRSTVHPLRSDMPILLAAEGPRNVALAAELFDGWLPMLYSPRNDAHLRSALDQGFTRRLTAMPRDGFEVVCNVPFIPGADVDACAELIKPFIALYIGGMGARQQNFHFDAVARLGFEAEATAVQEHYLAGRKREAAAAVPTALCEEIALVGPAAKIREDLAAWRRSPVTTIVIQGPVDLLRQAADLVLG